MAFIRHHLSWLLCGWLACQLTALAAPVVLAAAGAAPVEELCTCAGGDHETCPMHHGGPTAPDGASPCAVSASCVPGHIALLSMAGGAGILPSAITVTRQTASAPVSIADPSAERFVLTRDTPPPRF
ncbi:MAG TPA: hypothetical protein VM032_13385 [Vicinamibacterales bacterium]|nr:hypothetical protein [Vicinamibacterales bacterium]